MFGPFFRNFCQRNGPRNCWAAFFPTWRLQTTSPAQLWFMESGEVKMMNFCIKNLSLRASTLQFSEFTRSGRLDTLLVRIAAFASFTFETHQLQIDSEVTKAKTLKNSSFPPHLCTYHARTCAASVFFFKFRVLTPCCGKRRLCIKRRPPSVARHVAPFARAQSPANEKALMSPRSRQGMIFLSPIEMVERRTVKILPSYYRNIMY